LSKKREGNPTPQTGKEPRASDNRCVMCNEKQKAILQQTWGIRKEHGPKQVENHNLGWTGKGKKSRPPAQMPINWPKKGDQRESFGRRRKKVEKGRKSSANRTTAPRYFLCFFWGGLGFFVGCLFYRKRQETVNQESKTPAGRTDQRGLITFRKAQKRGVQ